MTDTRSTATGGAGPGQDGGPLASSPQVGVGSVVVTNTTNGTLTTMVPALTTVIEALGSTSLVQVDNNYFVSSVGGPLGPELSAFGAPVVAGQFGSFVPIAAEASASGYEVAWKATDADQYTVLNADGNGTFLSHAFFVVSGSSFELESVEASFQQDLNKDGTIGAVTTVIEASGSTSLEQVANACFLDPVGGSSGTRLRFSGAAVTTGQFGAWAPVAAEQTASGYELPGSSRAPINTRCGPPTAAAITSQASSARYRVRARRWKNSNPVSIKTSTTTGLLVRS